MNEKGLLKKSIGNTSLERILIIKPSSLGDIIQSIPVAVALHREYPSIEITWVVNTEYVELLELIPDIDNIIPFERARWAKSANFSKIQREFRVFIRNIKAQDYGIALDLQGLFRSGLICFLSGIPERVGFRDAREGAFIFYNHKVGVPQERRHAIERYLTLAEYLGCEYRAPVFNINVPSRFEVGARGYITINPGGRWLTKRWPVEKFASLIDILIQRYRLDVVLIGDRGDRGIIDYLNTELPVRKGIIDLIGKTGLVQLVGILNDTRLLITNDSGPMHLASALGRPVVALFGPTDPGLTGPWGKKSRVIQSRVSCSPCLKKKCRDIECMEAITVEEVLTAIEDVLQKE